nr:MAG TPA: hypothetical protein [Caudoviricetes sp.]
MTAGWCDCKRHHRCTRRRCRSRSRRRDTSASPSA